ncbi:hybrid sensor histidine kinase/response regulator [Halobellus marinus]|uniref:hybrid sensor histidine kinase/response regulator n=1 Tax=Halobellus TaxID=1073986 RepID=UPI0028ADCB17|nr:PAS domain S-box protein [Halobellus sp. DFY28]
MDNYDGSMRILYVDDDPEFAEMAATFLERGNDRFDVEIETRTDEALDRLGSELFDCIVSDYEMPTRNGLEFLQAVREEYPDLPFILYTGKGSEEVASDAISAGVTDYLQKKTGTSQYTVLANRIRNAVDNYYAQIELADREKRLNLFFEQSPLGVIEWDEQFDFVRMNDVAGDILGYTQADLLGQSWEKIVPDSDRDAVADVVSDLLENQGGYRSVNENIRKDGGRIICEWHNRVVTDEDEAVVAVFSQFQDITERKRREQELREEQALIERSLDTLEDIFYFVDTDGNFQRWNSKLPELTGYTDEQIGSMNALEFFEGEHREAINHSIHEILETGSHVTEAEITTADGRQVPHEFRGVRMTNDEGEPTGIIGIARDITERRERERQLEQQTEELEQLATKYEVQYRTLFEEAPVMTILTRSEDGQPVIEDCNSQFVETLGYDEDAIIGSELAEFYTRESAERLLSGGYNRSLDGQFTREKRGLVTIDGEVIETVLRAVPRRTADDEIIGTVAMYMDITERESVKRANERLEEFTSVVSHDLRNPLNVATGRLELAAEECDSEHLDRLEQVLDRMAALIDNLLTLTREGREVTDTQPVDLATMIDGCWENVETNEAVLITNIDRGVRADRSRLKQVFENLFRNAVEHGGTDVTVTVGELDHGFYIEDDGPGIPSGERDEVFEAGYSRSSEGTGFGLSIVEQVVTAHNWQIRVTDGPDGGARFEITDVEFVAP